MSFNANKLISSFDFIYILTCTPRLTSSSKLAISHVDYYQLKTELIDYQALERLSSRLTLFHMVQCMRQLPTSKVPSVNTLQV